MKYLLTVLLFTAISLNVFSQNKFVASVGAGISIPVSNDAFENAYEMGFIIQGTGGYILSNNNVLVRGSLAYNRFALDEADPEFSGSFKSVSLKGEVAFGNFSLANQVQPYALAGLGIYFVSSNRTSGNVTVSSSDTELGLSAGGGVNFRVGTTTSVFLEADYNVILNDGPNVGYLPIKVGVQFFP